MEQAKQQQRKLVSAGTFCPNKECPLYASVEEGDLIKYGRSRRGVQRYQCKRCKSTFADTRGTLFYRKHTPLKDILETLALLAEGVRIRSASRGRRVSRRTRS